MLGLAINHGLAVAISEVQTDKRVKIECEHIINEQTRSVLCVPFVYEGRTFGAAELINRTGGDSWRERETHLVTYIGAQLGEYIAQSLPSSDDDFEADFAEYEKQTRRSSVPAKPKQEKETKKTKSSKKSRKKKKK